MKKGQAEGQNFQRSMRSAALRLFPEGDHGTRTRPRVGMKSNLASGCRAFSFVIVLDLGPFVEDKGVVQRITIDPSLSWLKVERVPISRKGTLNGEKARAVANVRKRSQH